MLTERRSRTPATRNGWRMNLDKFAGGELTRLIRKGINEILDNIENILGGDLEDISDEVKSDYISKLKVIPFTSLGKQLPP